MKSRGPWQSNKIVVEHGVLPGLQGSFSLFFCHCWNVLFPKSCPGASSESFSICTLWQQACKQAHLQQWQKPAKQKPEMWIQFYLTGRIINFCSGASQKTLHLSLVCWNFVKNNMRMPSTESCWFGSCLAEDKRNKRPQQRQIFKTTRKSEHFL